MSTMEKAEKINGSFKLFLSSTCSTCSPSLDSQQCRLSHWRHPVRALKGLDFGGNLQGKYRFLVSKQQASWWNSKTTQVSFQPRPLSHEARKCQTQKRLWPISRPHTSGRGGRQSTRSIFGLQKVSFKIPQIGCDQEIQLEIAWNGWFCSPKMARKGKVTTEYDRWFCREMESSPSWT